MKPVLDVRYLAGVDCAGATDSSAALNELTSTVDTSTNKTLSFRGCPLIRLDSTWLIHGQENIEIDLGDTENNGGNIGNTTQSNTLIFGCNGSAGPLVHVDRSGYTYIHGGGITAGTSGNCSRSNFTRSIEYTNSGAGGYTDTANRLANIWLSTSKLGGAIANYAGVYINGTPNQEEMKFLNVRINCQHSPRSYGFWQNDPNADSTVFEYGAINDCYHGVHNDNGGLRVRYADLSGNGTYSVFGHGGATIFGPLDELAFNVIAEDSGTLQIPNAGGNAGGFFAYNQACINSGAIDPSAYFIDIGRGSTLILQRNSFCNNGGSPHNGVLVGSAWADANNHGVVVATLIDLGGNQLGNNSSAGRTIPLTKSVWVADQFLGYGKTSQTFLDNLNFYNSAGTNAGWGLLPHGTGLPTTANNWAGQTSAPLSWFTAWGQGKSTVVDRYVLQATGYNKTNGTSTLVLNHVSPSGLTIQPSLALGVNLSGLQTAAVETPLVQSVMPAGKGGSTTYSYQVTALGGYGESAPTPAATIKNGTATLSSKNYNQLYILPTGGARAFNVYRTAGGSTNGLIGTAYAAPLDGNATAILFADTGLAGNGVMPPSTSTADGSINLRRGATYKIDGAQISSADLSDGPFHSGISGVYSTVMSKTGAGIPLTTMATPKSDTTYLFTIYISQTKATSGCSSQPKASAVLRYTGAFSGTQPRERVLTANPNGGGDYQVIFGSSLTDSTEYSAMFSFRAKANTSVQYAVNYSAGSGCTNGAAYSVAPVLTQQ